ncbi:MAG: hypothetical protein HY784_04025 [Chloroflexi bacterium]|nr:hypothetical protein [Chloroflexota bacterium]
MSRPLPERRRLSAVTAIILLAFALARAVNLPARVATVTLFGSPFRLDLTGNMLLVLLAAGLIATGSDSLLRAHPRLAGQRGRTTAMHWILPGLTAMGLGSALSLAPTGPLWWGGLAVSALLLLLVLLGEFIAVDPADPRYDAAALGLSALAYALVVLLTGLLHAAHLRSAMAAPPAALSIGLVGLRLFALNGLPGRRTWPYAAALALLAAESLWALNYWRVGRIGAGLLLLGPAYAWVGLSQAHVRGELTRRRALEYALVGGLALLVGLILAGVR